jgi:exosortase
VNSTVQDIAIQGPIASAEDSHSWLALWQAVILVAVIGFLYRSILWNLVGQWWTDPNFSHGFFVPMFSAFVVWRDREKLRKIPVRRSWWGLPVVVASLMTLVVGILGAELFLSRTSLILLLGGLVIYFAGWPLFRALLFPWFFLFLMVPIPSIVFNQITLPLQFFASQLATHILRMLGVPVLREGNIIILPSMPLEVAEACSGIRSLMSLGTMAIIYGYFVDSKVWRRVSLALLALPVAVAANAIRIVGTGLTVQYWDPDKGQGFFHEFSGWLIFVVSLAMLFGLHSLLRAIDRSTNKAT